MLVLVYLLSLLPFVFATFGNKPICGTTTVGCTRTTTVPGSATTTVTRTVPAWCTTTVTKPTTECKTTTVTSTGTVTKTPTVIVTGTPTATRTLTVCAATSTVCANKWKKDEIPKHLTNAERMQLGLPLRSPQEEKRFFWPVGPSCTPTTVSSTAWVTKTTAPCATTNVQSCLLTKTSYIPTITLVTKTSTCYSTITAPPVTSTKPCSNPTTTVTVRTTATVTSKWCW